MMRKFDEKNYTWDGVDTLVYKADGSPFKDVTRQVLFDGAFDIPCQFRYFEVKPGGYSTLEYHEHTHMVMIFRGHGQCLLGDEIKDVKVGDFIEIPSHTIHQFRANKGDYVGFEIPDEFVVGYGLDYAQHHRNLPYVGMVVKK